MKGVIVASVYRVCRQINHQRVRPFVTHMSIASVVLGHLILTVLLANPAVAQTVPTWKPVVYVYRATGTGAASLRARASELARTAGPRRVTIQSLLRFVPEKDTWEPMALPSLPTVDVPVPAPRQVYSGDTDQVILAIQDPVGLFWIEWEEDGNAAAGFLIAGPVLCNDVRLGPAPPGRVAACVPFEDRAEARFVPDPSSLGG
jgi:hypothetical protein